METLPNEMQQSGHNLFETLQSQLQRSVEVCDLLEALADELPRRSLSIWRAAKLQCRNELNAHVALGRDQIVPLLIEPGHQSELERNLVLRFGAEYRATAHRVENLDDLLFDAVASDGTGIGSEALGYALRGHFEALRKSFDWERGILLPMIMRAQSMRDRLQRDTHDAHARNAH